MISLSPSRQRNICSLVLLGFLCLFGILACTAPYWAAFMLRELKARIDVYIMYGSTVGKVFWDMVVLLISFAVMNAGGRYRVTHRLPPLMLLLAVIFVCSTLLWRFDFDEVALVKETYHINPEGWAWIQMCKDGAYYHEFVSLEHTHTLKALAHKILFPSQHFITGEGFDALIDVPITYPLILLSLSLMAYLLSLLWLSELPLGMSLMYAWGFYVIFFSYFDGGVSAGATGLGMMAVALLPLPSTLRQGLQWLALAAIMIAVSMGIGFAEQYLFYKFSSYEPLHAIPPLTPRFWRYIGEVTQEHYIVLLFVAGFMFLRLRIWLALLLLCTAVTLYSAKTDAWHSDNKNTLEVLPGKPVAVFLYTDAPVTVGTPLITASNYKLIEYTPPEQMTRWDLCQQLLSQTEGLSYKSLAVTVYCQVFVIPPESSYHKSGTSFQVLESGQCGFTCDNDRLNELFPLIGEGKRRHIAGLTDTPRDHAIPMCLLPVTKITTQTFKAKDDDPDPP